MYQHLHSTFDIRHSTFCILHSTFYILHSTFYMLHSTFYILQATFYVLHSTHYNHQNAPCAQDECNAIPFNIQCMRHVETVCINLIHHLHRWNTPASSIQCSSGTLHLTPQSACAPFETLRNHLIPPSVTAYARMVLHHPHDTFR
jgi:hypothetical protein